CRSRRRGCGCGGRPPGAPAVSDPGRGLRLDARRAALPAAQPGLPLLGAAAGRRCPAPARPHSGNAGVAVVAAVPRAGPGAGAAGPRPGTAARGRPPGYLRDPTGRSPATGALFAVLLRSAGAMGCWVTVTGMVVAVTLAQGGAGQLHIVGVASGAGSLRLHVV